jgi:hypothetical protein
VNTGVLIDRTNVEVILGTYGVGTATNLSDSALLPRVQEYRRRTGALMRALARDELREKAPEANYHVSRKMDGEFTVLVYQDGDVFTINPGGAVRFGLPWQAEAAELLNKAGVRNAQIAGELYVQCDDRRARVHDVVSVARQPKTPDDLQRLQFAAFDLLSLNDQPLQSFELVWRELERIFGIGKLVRPVDATFVKSTEEIERLFEAWVEAEGAEGLVIRSDAVGCYKVKPKHTLDVAVVGFSESQGDREGLLHDLLLGVIRNDGTIQILSRVGGGFSNEQRREFLCDLKDMVVESEFSEVNADNVAYQMVRPEWIVEISCLDVISQNTRGGPINRMILEFDGGYRVVRQLPLATVISPQFVRRREDKTLRVEDAGIAQVARIVDVPLADRSARQMKLPPSEVIRREVYTKTAKGETMVRKFVAWRTNKDSESDEYPAFVLHYTDFSPNRKSPLDREVRVSSSRDQILSLFDALKEENIKKGWEMASAINSVVADAPITEGPTVLEKALSTRRTPTDPVVESGGEPAADAAQTAASKKKGAAPAKTRRATTKKKTG